MIIKEADSRSADIQVLRELATSARSGQRKHIATELRNLRAGLKAEKDAAYEIDFHYRDSRNWAVLHDLRLEVDGRVAQIDHLLISRTMLLFAIETKSFHAGFKITDDGEFLRWNKFERTYEGMASPIAQNERHVLVLKSLLKRLPLPTRMGFRLEPKIVPLVLVTSNARIDRPRKFDSSHVIKADALKNAVNRIFDAQGAHVLAKIVSSETLEELATSIAAHHKPAEFDYAARFGMSKPPRSTVSSEETTPKVQPAPPREHAAPTSAAPAFAGQATATATSASLAFSPHCRHCDCTDLVITHGRYGYYFKCTSCAGNTPIKIGCGRPSHRERLRKHGRSFYRECADCETSALFYENPQETASEMPALS